MNFKWLKVIQKFLQNTENLRTSIFSKSDSNYQHIELADVENEFESVKSPDFQIYPLQGSSLTTAIPLVF